MKRLAALPGSLPPWCGRPGPGVRFLAYLLGIALKESRRLSEVENGG
ncbi:MAG: hypothetical protein ACLQF1_03160 [Methyloceanibacter sp.]